MSPFPRESIKVEPQLRSAFCQALQDSLPPLPPVLSIQGQGRNRRGPWPSEATGCERGAGAGFGPHKRSGGTREPVAGELSGLHELTLEEG